MSNTKKIGFGQHKISFRLGRIVAENCVIAQTRQTSKLNLLEAEKKHGTSKLRWFHYWCCWLCEISTHKCWNLRSATRKQWTRKMFQSIKEEKQKHWHQKLTQFFVSLNDVEVNNQPSYIIICARERCHDTFALACLFVIIKVFNFCCCSTVPVELLLLLNMHLNVSYGMDRMNMALCHELQLNAIQKS